VHRLGPLCLVGSDFPHLAEQIADFAGHSR
jgi:hypothetical protein